MYGMVNKAVQDMVIRNHGEGVWNQIRAKAGVDLEVFMTNEGYPDKITYDLVAASSEVLGLSSDDVLHAFGEHWILHTAQEGYGSLMRAAGNTLPEFFSYLPLFHDRVGMIFPHLQPPRFEITDLSDRSLQLHYFSHRPGLAPFVVGLMSGLGKMFNTPVTVTTINSKQDGADHDVFLMTW